MHVAHSVDGMIAQAANFRREQRMEEALDLLVAAARQAPSDPRAAFGLAQTSFECWRPSVDLFAAARRLIPDQPDLVRNHALAIAAEGDSGTAEAMLDTIVEQQPLWLDGHRALASLRITHRKDVSADASYRRACEQRPDDIGLRLAWFQHHAITKNWIDAASILDDWPATLPESDGLKMARIFLRSEGGDPDLVDADFASYAIRGDPGFDLCQIRYLLRHRRAREAERISQRHMASAQARNFWPYLSLCWRLVEDPRSHWLDGQPPFVDAIDLAIPSKELDELAVVLRDLHRLSAPYPEQSVRGGTQTDRQLFFNPDSAIQKIRHRAISAVSQYVERLPETVVGHPLLGHMRDSVLFAGSWSVQLPSQGYHSSHTHIMGWISSALYVALPSQLGPTPAGCLAIGSPPPELDLGLAPYCHVEPKEGRLVLFPSTMWHATEPFSDGERLTIAFDVAIPSQM